MSRIASAIDQNAAMNRRSISVRHRSITPHPKDLKEARAQQLHEWDNGYIQGLPDNLRRKEKLMDMRNNVGVPPPPKAMDRRPWMMDPDGMKDTMCLVHSKFCAAHHNGAVKFHTHPQPYILTTNPSDPHDRPSNRHNNPWSPQYSRVGEMNYISSAFAGHAVTPRSEGLRAARTTSLDQWGHGGGKLRREEELRYMREVIIPGETSLGARLCKP